MTEQKVFLQIFLTNIEMNIPKIVPKRLAKNFPADFFDQHRHEYQKTWTIELAKKFPADFLCSLVEFAYFIQWIQPESDF